MSYYTMLFGKDKEPERKEDSKYTPRDAKVIREQWNRAVELLKASKVDLNKIPITRGNG